MIVQIIHFPAKQFKNCTKNLNNFEFPTKICCDKHITIENYHKFMTY